MGRSASSVVRALSAVAPRGWISGAGIAVAIVSLGLLLYDASVVPPFVRTAMIDAAAMGHDGGQRYVWGVAPRGGNTAAEPTRSGLVLYEDGRPLGPAHALHADVETSGGGAYSHWGRSLLFSTSDGSDPRTNGRDYTIACPRALPRPVRRGLPILLLLGILTWAAGTYRRTRQIGAARPAGVIVAASLVLVVSGVPLLYEIRIVPNVWATHELPATGMTSGEGHLVSAPLPVSIGRRGDTAGIPGRSALVLLEDGRPLGPRHALHARIRELGRGRYAHWGARILFSSSDGTDPRTNGRAYRVRGPVSLGAPLVAAAAWAFGAAALVLAVVLAGRAAGAGWRYVVARPSRALGAPAIVTIVVSLVPIGLLLVLPPTWNRYDAIVVLAQSVHDGVIPHYPAAYPLFARSINAVVTFLFAHDVAAVTGHLAFAVSNAGVYAIVLVQHALLVSSIVFLTGIGGRPWPWRLAAALPFVLVPDLFLYTHGIFTESIALPVIIVLVVIAARLVRAGDVGRGWFVAYGLVLWLAILVRHPSAVLAGLVPGAILLALPWSRSRSRDLRRFAVVLLLSVAAIIVSGFVNRVATAAVGVEPRSIVGRAAAYQFNKVDWEGMDPAARDALIGAMQEAAPDALVRDAVPVALRPADGWLPTYDAVAAMIEASEGRYGWEESVAVAADRALREVFGLYVACARDLYLERVRAELGRYGLFFVRRSAEPDFGVLAISRRAMDEFAAITPDPLPHLTIIGLPAAEAYERFEGSLWHRATRRIEDAYLLVLLVAIVVVRLRRRRLEPGVATLAVSGIAVIGIYTVLMAAVTEFHPRYPVFTTVVLCALVGVVVGVDAGAGVDADADAGLGVDPRV